MLYTGKQNPGGGFTLIELMVVLVIIIALAILVLAGYSESRSRLAVERTVESFISDVNKARRRAPTAFTDEDEGGHGVYIMKGGEDYDLYVYEEEERVSTENVKIEENVHVLDITVSGHSKNDLRVFFSPERSVYFNEEEAEGKEARVVFSAKGDDSISKTVVINLEENREVIYINDN